MGLSNHVFGLAAEAQAKQFLEQHNYQIIAERYCSKQRRAGAGEIDLIALKNNCYHFVEVKARKQQSAALYALSPTQQQRLQTAASCFFAEHNLPEDTPCQFDYIIIVQGQLQLLENILY